MRILWLKIPMLKVLLLFERDTAMEGMGTDIRLNPCVMCSVVSLSLYPNIPVAHALVGSSREDEGLLCPFCHCCNCRLKPDFVFVSTFWDLVEVCF